MDEAIIKLGYIRGLLLLAALSLFVTLLLPYIGEEGYYTISAYEMWYHHQYLYPIAYGINYGRPPLFNWLIISAASLLGWQHMLIASRLITAIASILTMFLLVWFSNRLFKNRLLNSLVALIYLSGDALFCRGWLAYSDPLFSLFIFGAIACLWLGHLDKSFGLIALSAIAIVAAFLTKALTAYIFYSVAFAVLIWQYRHRHFLLKPVYYLPVFLAFCFPSFWYWITHGANGAGMVHDIYDKFRLPAIGAYLKQIITFPLEVFLRFLPGGFVVVYFLIRRRARTLTEDHVPYIHALIAITVINFLPYWWVPNTAIRYIMPLYPFTALIIAHTLWRMPAQEIRIGLYTLAAGIVIKYIYVLGFLPYYQQHYRGDYMAAAQQILQRTSAFPLYANDTSATGLSVTAYLDLLRYPDPPLVKSDLAKQADYFVINYDTDSFFGQPFAIHPLGKHHQIYMLCHGKACEQG